LARKRNISENFAFIISIEIEIAYFPCEQSVVQQAFIWTAYVYKF